MSPTFTEHAMYLFVAPKTKTRFSPCDDNNPSHSVINSAFIMDVASWSALCLFRRNESISSMKMIVGCSFLASENNACTSFCDSPNHFSVRVLTVPGEGGLGWFPRHRQRNRQQQRTVQVDKRRLGLPRQGLGQHCFPTSGRTIEKNALWRAKKIRRRKQIRVDERVDDGFLQRVDNEVQPADVFASVSTRSAS